MRIKNTTQHTLQHLAYSRPSINGSNHIVISLLTIDGLRLLWWPVDVNPELVT